MQYTFLSKKFYEDYSKNKYPQIEMKENRPYAHIYLELYGYTFAIPLRSNIDHPHAFFTDKKNKCGVDYSKSVVITNQDYIDTSTKVFLRNNEFKKLQGKDYRIKKEFQKYIELYKRAKTDKNVPHRDKIISFSTLQYFEEYIMKL
ncbi:type III toxin-antitoxin system TenpIN family toxin [Velocimicrobium porci]|uniref:Type III toxin-antitoxin system ToxN/AbiQ family toxin n=1 Tax=Velocimicrobium porci TaxID=2606634 RepID=A0A6L5XXS1_9FIRM|nr:hypothetical protein [Velocimicrobium porci]MSS63088.1 hypothetical protein [Velocimicrobium porci]